MLTTFIVNLTQPVVTYDLKYGISFIRLACGCASRASSWVLVDVVAPIPLWVVPYLVMWSWAVQKMLARHQLGNT